MEKISLIKKDLEEKSGKEWLGLQRQTENRLVSLIWYLDHVKVQENPKLVEEIIELYNTAKITNFIKMEGIIRKLDQLSIKFSKESAIRKTPFAQSRSLRGEPAIYAKLIEEFIKQLDDFLSSTSGTSLPEKTKKSLITFLDYLNHPKLISKTGLYEEMREKYDKAEEQDFLSMSVFDDMLNKCEIKLGAITDESKKWKSPEEKKKEFEAAIENFEAEKESFQENLKNLEIESEAMKVEREKMENEKGQIEKERENLVIEHEEMNEERKKLEAEKSQIEKEQGTLKNAQGNLETEKELFQEKLKNLELEGEAMKVEREKIETEKVQMEKERGNLEIEREAVKDEREKIET
ncbi:hypothetical protein LCGC14_1852240, partial [marine sediment metagenome]